MVQAFNPMPGTTNPMKLLGSTRSPYVRRVAVSLNLMGLDWELDQVAVFDDPESVRRYNPLLRIPTLLLDDGEALVESYAILDALDEMAGDKRLMPASGKTRRDVMRATAMATGAMDRTIWAVYEPRFRPKEKVEESWIAHNRERALGGMQYLDGLAAEAGDGWLFGDSMSQADISAVCGFTFARFAHPPMKVAEACPALAALAERCEAMEEFGSTFPF